MRFFSILEVDVKKKKNNLRRYYNRELAKSNESKKVELEPTERAVSNDHLSNDVFLERQYNAKKNQFIFCKISILQMTTKIRSKTNRRLFMISWRNRY